MNFELSDENRRKSVTINFSKVVQDRTWSVLGGLWHQKRDFKRNSNVLSEILEVVFLAQIVWRP